jgi:hypothetical protein
MKKVGVVLGVLLAICFCLGFAAHAEEDEATGALAGTWSVSENYESAGTYTATWNINQLVGPFYLVTATRSTGEQRKGIGIELGSKGIVKHKCYGAECGDCGYTFKGQISGSTFSGTATYKCSDGSVYPGTFTATKTSGGSVDSVPESDGVDPQ